MGQSCKKIFLLAAQFAFFILLFFLELLDCPDMLILHLICFIRDSLHGMLSKILIGLVGWRVNLK